MTDQQINEAIARECGWKIEKNRKGKGKKWVGPNGEGSHGGGLHGWGYNEAARPTYPDYVNDLNAMHEAEKCVTLEQRRTYWQHLYRVTERGRMAEPGWLTTTATAPQRAEAFLRTLNKWTV